ncbi:MAG: aminotransferase class I/II-fold pyridoxal phosphate-dependent enzyme, partial [Sphaerochaetaceae bacterium]
VYTPIQIAAAKALDVFFDRDIHNKQSKLYQERRDFAVKELNKKGWKCFNAQGTMYIWAELPIKDSLVFVKKLWEDKRVMLIPGVMYGDNLGKYVRLALVGGDLEYLKNALNQIPSIDSPLYDC